MADFFFFTELEKLENQTEANSFASITPDSPSTGFSSFNVTSAHTASSDPKAFAISDGELYVYAHSNGTHAALVLKPSTQASSKKHVDIPRIKYFIYRGLDLSKFKSGDLIADSGLGVEWIDYIHENSSTDIYFSSLEIKQKLGVGLATPFSYTFFKEDVFTGESPKVKAGDCIGCFFSGGFSLEIVFDDFEYEPTVLDLEDYLIHHEICLEDGGDTEAERFKNGRKKDIVLHFMDPCAFYGSNYFSTIKCKDASANITSYKENEIYHHVLSKFPTNKNVIYLDFRNEVGKSFNYYRFLNSAYQLESERFFPQYKDEIKIMQEISGSVALEVFDSDYYNNGWPMRKLPLLQVNTGPNLSNKNLLKISMPVETDFATNNFDFEQIAIISKGFINKGDKSKNLKFNEPKSKKRFFDLDNHDNDYFESFEVPVPNEDSDDKIIPICWYVRIIYGRRYRLKSGGPWYGGSKKTNLPTHYFTDSIFPPIDIKLPKNNSTGIQFKTFDNEAYIDFSFENKKDQTDYVGKIGFAKDSEYTSLYVIPAISRKKSIKGMSEMLSHNYGLVNSTDNFLEYLDKKLLYRSIIPLDLTFGTGPDPEIKKVHKFDTLGLFHGKTSKRALKKANALVFIMKNENWDAVLSLINAKITDNQIDPDLDITLCISARNKTADSKDNKQQKYMTFNLAIKGFETTSAEVLPVEFDTSIHFYAKVENDTVYIHTIFTDGNIASPLISTSYIDYTCPFIALAPDVSRPYDYSYFIDDYAQNTTTKDDQIEALTEIVDLVSTEDFEDFITQMYNESIYVDSTSGEYMIKAQAHNRFLLYKEVYSKYIKLDHTQPDGFTIYLAKTSIDTPFYSGATMQHYNNFFPPEFDGGKVQLLMDLDGLKSSSTIAHEGFFIESIFAFSLWKIGHDMEIITTALTALSNWDYGPAVDVAYLASLQTDFNKLRKASPLFNNLCVCLEKNQINTPGYLPITTGLTKSIFNDAIVDLDEDNNDIMTNFIDLFEQNRFYTTQEEGLDTHEGWQLRIENYLTSIEPYNGYRINWADDAQRKLAIDFYGIKSAYLRSYIFCLYEYLGGKGRNHQFFNFANGDVQHFTGNVLEDYRGSFLMDLHLSPASTQESRHKTITLDLGGARNPGEIAIVHLGTYGIDQSDFTRLKIEFINGGTTRTSLVLKDYEYRWKLASANDDWTGPMKLGYFNVEKGDLVITNPNVSSLAIKIEGTTLSTSPELMFNTISYSVVPLVNTFSKAFEIAFEDDVFQLTTDQQNGIWLNEQDNLKILVDIILNQKPDVEVSMLGGFIGKRKFPSSYVSGEYLENEQVIYVDNDVLKVYKASDATSTLPTDVGDWDVMEYAESISYVAGDFVSMNSCIYVAKSSFTSSSSTTPPTDSSTSTEILSSPWEKIACLYDAEKDYRSHDLVIGSRIAEDGTAGPLHLFECLINCRKMGLHDWKFWIPAPEVTSDQRYVFDELDTLHKWKPVELEEEITPPIEGTKKYNDFAKCRYAQTQIYWDEDSKTLKIDVEAYASPLISRLDNHLNPSTNYPSHTLYGQYPNALNFGRIDHGVDGLMPSYNQLLTALRTWGILEALTEKIKEYTGTYVGSSELTIVTAKMNEILDLAFVDTIKTINSYTYMVNNSIDKTIYLDMKSHYTP